MMDKKRMTSDESTSYLLALRRLAGKPEFQKCAYCLRERPCRCTAEQPATVETPEDDCA